MKTIILLLVLFITTNCFAQKENIPPPPPPIEKSDDVEGDEIFQEVEIESEFPGGIDAWRKFLIKNLKANIPAKKGAPVGTYTVVVRFVVGKDGKLSDFAIEKNAEYGTGDEVLRVMKKSPKWKPGVQNGTTVSSVKRQPISFQVTN